MTNGNIKVIEPIDDYKRIHKSIIKNANIDCTTLGVYTKLVVLGAEWQLNIKGLSTVLKMSDAKVRKSIGILEKEGYIKRTANYHDGKLDGWIYEIYPTPINECERSSAGYAKCDDETHQCCAETSVTEKQTTLEPDMTENGEDINNRLNIIEDLINIKKKEIDKSISKISQKSNKFGLDMSFVDESFIPILIEWLEYKKEKKQAYKQRGFATLYKNLMQMSGGNADVARKIVEQSMQNNYAGLFPLRQANNYSQQSLPTGMIITESAEERNKKYEQSMLDLWK